MNHLLFLDAVKPGEVLLLVAIIVIGIPILTYRWGFKTGYLKGRYDESKGKPE